MKNGLIESANGDKHWYLDDKQVNENELCDLKLPIQSGNITCPNCGSFGEDLVFSFYCSNNSCQNYKK